MPCFSPWPPLPPHSIPRPRLPSPSTHPSPAPTSGLSSSSSGARRLGGQEAPTCTRSKAPTNLWAWGSGQGGCRGGERRGGGAWEAGGSRPCQKPTPCKAGCMHGGMRPTCTRSHDAQNDPAGCSAQRLVCSAGLSASLAPQPCRRRSPACSSFGAQSARHRPRQQTCSGREHRVQSSRGWSIDVGAGREGGSRGCGRVGERTTTAAAAAAPAAASAAAPAAHRLTDTDAPTNMAPPTTADNNPLPAARAAHPPTQAHSGLEEVRRFTASRPMLTHSRRTSNPTAAPLRPTNTAPAAVSRPQPLPASRN